MIDLSRIRGIPTSNKGALRAIARRGNLSNGVIDVTPNITTIARGQAQQSSNLARQLAVLTAQVDALSKYVIQDAGEVVEPARVAEGYSLYAAPDENGKGGIVWVPKVEFAAGAVAGTKASESVEGLNHARLTSTNMRAIQFVLTGGLADLTQSAKIVASLILTGMTNNRLNRIPLDFAPGPGGIIVSTFPIPQGIYIPPDSYVEFEYEVVADLSTVATGAVEARIIAGE